MIRRPRLSTLFPYTTLFRSDEGRVEDICECIGCNVCISRFNLNSTIVCTQNPTAMEEYRRGWHPEKFAIAPRPSSVLVVEIGRAHVCSSHSQISYAVFCLKKKNISPTEVTSHTYPIRAMIIDTACKHSEYCTLVHPARLARTLESFPNGSLCPFPSPSWHTA